MAGRRVPGHLVLDEDAHALGIRGFVYREDVGPVSVAETAVLPPVDSTDLWEPRWRKTRRGRHVADVETGTTSSASTAGSALA